MEDPDSRDNVSTLADEALCHVILTDTLSAAGTVQPALGTSSREAFEVLYARHYPALCRTIWFLLGFSPNARQDAEFVANGVMARLYAAIISDKYDPQRPFKPYLNESMRNAARDWQRTSGRFEQCDETPETPTDDSLSPISQILAKEQRGMIQKVLTALPADYQEILLLRYVEGLSHGEIEERLGLTNGALRGRIQRAKHRYRQEFSDLYGE